VLRDLLIYGHPLLATVSVFLAFLVYRDGFAQRKLRLRRVPPPEGSRARHVKLGPWSTALMVGSALTGLASSVWLRNWAPLDKFHGKLAVVTTLMFVIMWWLGRRLVANERQLANTHGILGVLALFAAGLTAVLGISLLP
jgi:hypothetical protein